LELASLVVVSVVWQEFGDRICEGKIASGVRCEAGRRRRLPDGCSASGRCLGVRVGVE
jgi:hypothetical protein